MTAMEVEAAEDSNQEVESGGMTTEETAEDKQRAEEYKIWRKNTPFLYDTVVTHSLEWPSLTVQWMPEYTRRDKSEAHKVVLGTHTSGNEPNYLMVADVLLPNPESEIDSKNYNADKEEVGGYGGSLAKIDERIKMTHLGEVNRARMCPHNPFIIATKSPVAGSVFIFDYSKHSSSPPPEPRPNHTCLGHTAEGYGLDWSPLSKLHLLSGSDDARICLWDVNNAGPQVSAISTWTGHDSVVEDVDWHHFSPHLFGSVGDDKSFCLWDTRKASENKAAQVVNEAHSDDINCVEFNPLNQYLVATGGSDGKINVWDVRNLKECFHSLESHTKGVYQACWSPHSEFCLASGSADTRIMCWDLSRIGEEQTREQSEAGPPELIFIHGGHTAKVSDLSWNEHKPWTFASVAEDNILQVWQMTESNYIRETRPGDTITDDDLEG